MRIGYNGRLEDTPQIRAGFIGCGSHAFRNIYPTFQFAPVDRVAVCDLDIERAEAFARQFGARKAYSNHHQMLEAENLDAVFIVVGYDSNGRPLYPSIAQDCLRAGVHVWIEKPPAASAAELESLKAEAQSAGKNVLCGLKKMFFPANEKAHELMGHPDFGTPSLALLQYPQGIPLADEIAAYMQGANPGGVVGFLDHLCHPVSLLLYLLGMPNTLIYSRSASSAGIATFQFASGAVASLALTHGQSMNQGMERTVIVSDRGRHITVDNNHRVTYHKVGPVGYGDNPDFFKGGPGEASTAWEPEFSLGQLYNKGLFLLGYWGEVNEFAESILQNRPPAKAHLDHCIQATKIFEAFAQGPDHLIPL